MGDFSAEWLSKSFYDVKGVRSEMKDARRRANTPPHRRRAIPCSGSPAGVLDESKPRAFLSPDELGCSPRSKVDVDVEGGVRSRKLRVNFTPRKVRQLEKSFRQSRYLTTSLRRKLSVKLQLSETQVKTWFQNRRMRVKREGQDFPPQPPTVQRVLLPPMLEPPSLSGHFHRAPVLLQHFQPPYLGRQLPGVPVLLQPIRHPSLGEQLPGGPLLLQPVLQPPPFGGQLPGSPVLLQPVQHPSLSGQLPGASLLLQPFQHRPPGGQLPGAGGHAPPALQRQSADSRVPLPPPLHATPPHLNICLSYLATQSRKV